MQVSWQNEETLHQRCQNDTDNDGWDIDQNITDDTAYQHQRQEGRDGCHRRGGNRCKHAQGAANRCPARTLAYLGVRKGILTHHYGIIHDNTQRHNQAEERDHVDGAANHVEHCQRRQERNRDTHGDPERHATVEE